MIRTLHSLFQITKKEGKFLCLLILRCPFEAIRTTIQALFLNACFLAIERQDVKSLYKTCAIFLVGNIFLFLYNGIVWKSYAAFSISIQSSIREKVFKKISRLSMKQMDEKPSGEWFTRLNIDVEQAIALINQPLHLPHAVVAIVSIILCACILWIKNHAFFLLVLLFTIPHVVVSHCLVTKQINNLSKKALEANDNVASSMNAFITGAEIAILYDAKDFMLEQYEQQSLALRKVNMSIGGKHAIKDAILPMLGLSGYLLLLMIGSHAIFAGNMTFGELTALFQYRGGVLIGAMMLTSCVLSMKTATVGVKRVLETMYIQEEE